MELERARLITYLAECSEYAYKHRAYKMANNLGLQSILYLHDEQKDVPRGFIAQTRYGLVVAVKGTATIKDAVRDAMVKKVPFTDAYRVHNGVKLEFDTLWPTVKDAIGANRTVCVTGHSLGGGIATLLAFSIKSELSIDPEVVTFGSLATGNGKFVGAYNALVPRTTRVVHHMDIVPRLPWFYSHVDKELHLTTRGRLIIPGEGIFYKAVNIIKAIKSDLEWESIPDHHIPKYVAACKGHEHWLEKKLLKKAS